MYVLHCTRKLLGRLKAPMPDVPLPNSSTALGNWYGTTLPWRPQAVLLVSEPTLLPVLMPLAPAATLTTRFPGELARILDAHGVSSDFIDREIAAMDACAVAKTASRSLIGMLNEFSFLADMFRDSPESKDMLALSLKLATVPCGPLKGASPDRILQSLGRESRNGK